MKRGDVVIVGAAGDYGKPRPAVIVQSDLFNDTLASIAVCFLTTHIQDAPLLRIDIRPSAETGLKEHSQVMVDKILVMRRGRFGKRIGKVDRATLVQINRSLVLFLGLAQ